MVIIGQGARHSIASPSHSATVKRSTARQLVAPVPIPWSWCRSTSRHTYSPYFSQYDSQIFGETQTYRSIHVPGNRAPTRRAEKPFSSKCRTYQGSILAERSSIRPPIFKAWLSFCACTEASLPSGSNQSIESMT